VVVADLEGEAVVGAMVKEPLLVQDVQAVVAEAILEKA